MGKQAGWVSPSQHFGSFLVSGSKIGGRGRGESWWLGCGLKGCSDFLSIFLSFIYFIFFIFLNFVSLLLLLFFLELFVFRMSGCMSVFVLDLEYIHGNTVCNMHTLSLSLSRYDFLFYLFIPFALTSYPFPH